MIASFLMAIGIAISVLIQTLLPGSGGGGGTAGKPPPKNEEGVKE